MTLTTTAYDTDNVFAKIMRRDMPAAIVHEDDHVIVIMDAFPQSKGHCLVIPKAPSVNLLGVNPKDMGRIFGTVQRVAKAVSTAFSPDGIVITQFNGAPAGQTVFHTHVHIIPRYQSTAEQPHASGGMADMDTLLEQAKAITAAL